MGVKLKKSRSVSHGAMIEPLEGRRMLSASTTTELSLSTSSINIGQTISMMVTVTPTSGSSFPTGTVQIEEQNGGGDNLLGTVTLNAHGKGRLSTYRFYKGTDPIFAVYQGDSNFTSSTSATQNVVVAKGATIKTNDGLREVTAVAGTGVGAVSDYGITMNYTGYLDSGRKIGHEFQSTLDPGGQPFHVIVDQTSLIPGFTEGIHGMEVGEVRVLFIPSAIGYAGAKQMGIPVNSDLIFILQVLSIDLPQLGVTGSNSTALSSGAAPSANAGTDFGSVGVGSSSGSTTITLIASDTNAGLKFTSTPGDILAGADPGDFVLGQLTSNPSGGVEFTLTFTPKAHGTRTARIKILTDDAEHPTFTINIQGVGS